MNNLDELKNGYAKYFEKSTLMRQIPQNLFTPASFLYVMDFPFAVYLVFFYYKIK